MFPSSVSDDFSRTLLSTVMPSPSAIKLASYFPPSLSNMVMSMCPVDLLLVVLVHLSYRKVLRAAHRTQVLVWGALSKEKPDEYKKSILGFTEERTGLLVRLMACNYLAKLICIVFSKLGLRIRADLPVLISTVSYVLYLAHFLDQFKLSFLKQFLPAIAESRRQSYVFNQSASVAIWIFTGLLVCEMISTFLKVPLSSTLAFGGVGGLAIGLSARDIAANFLGGMLLLFNEPFTPGDMVSFRTNSVELVGRVERVGWGQTRIRGLDTRPTYIPNSHFVQSSVTNMERITHRKYETNVRLRLQDHAVMGEVIDKIKENLRTIPKLDVLSMPFRISFVRIGEYFLEVEIICYFATKSIDEYLSLQQAANTEVIKAIHSGGAALAVPTSLMKMEQLPVPVSVAEAAAGAAAGDVDAAAVP